MSMRGAAISRGLRIRKNNHLAPAWSRRLIVESCRALGIPCRKKQHARIALLTTPLLREDSGA